MDVHRRSDYTKYLALKSHSLITYGKELQTWPILGGPAHKTDPVHTLVRRGLGTRQRGREVDWWVREGTAPSKLRLFPNSLLQNCCRIWAFPTTLCHLPDLYLLQLIWFAVLSVPQVQNFIYAMSSFRTLWHGTIVA